MAISKAQVAAVNRYNAKAYDRVALMVPKGTKEQLQQHAKDRGESLNAFINRAISNQLAQDNQ